MQGIYMGSTEAAGYLLHTSMSKVWPTVTRLDIHLEGHERVFFDDGAPDTAENLQSAVDKAKSSLLAWFDANDKCKRNVGNFEGMTSLRYPEVPEFFAYNRQTNTWALRHGVVWDATSKSFTSTDRRRPRLPSVWDWKDEMDSSEGH